MLRGKLTVPVIAKNMDITEQAVRNWLVRDQIPHQIIDNVRIIEAFLVDSMLLTSRKSKKCKPAHIQMVRLVHDRLEQYQLEGGVYNVEPQRRSLDEIWHRGIRGLKVDIAEINKLFDFASKYVLVPTRLKDEK